MKIYTTLAFVLLLATVHAQTYVPFVTDGTDEWNMFESIGYPCVTERHYTYRVIGQTTINNQTYDQIQGTGYYFEYDFADPNNSQCDVPPTPYSTPVKLVREDNKKVYLYEGGVERLLYDFTAQVGDTIPDPGGEQQPVVVTAIDSALVGQNYRKLYNTTGVQIVEGVGGAVGPFETFFPPPEWLTFMQCYAEQGTPIYGNSNCILNVGIEELPGSLEVNLFPNPVEEQLTLALTTVPDGAYTLTIYDVMGKRQQHQQLNYASTWANPQTKVQLDVSALAQGTYILSIQLPDGSQQSYYFVKR